MIERDAKGKFQPGSGGRPVGARNRLQASFIEALAEDFAEHGASIIRIVRVEQPATYLKLIASILPRELLLPDNALEDMTDDDLAEALATIRRIRNEAVTAVPLAELGKPKVRH